MTFGAEFWVAIAFLLFVGLVVKFLRKNIIEILDARTNKIALQINEAQRLHDEAASLVANLAQKRANAMIEAKEIASSAQRETKLLLKNANDELGRFLTQKHNKAQQRMAEYEKSAIREFYHQVVELAVNSAAIYIAKNPSLQNNPELFAKFNQKLANTNLLRN